MTGCVRDHPRLRGEQKYPYKVDIITLGSPPLARGTGAFNASLRTFSRITPACAGNSCVAGRRVAGGWDHPRLRGEQKAPHGHFSARQGSPPLARGTGQSWHIFLQAIGITPACAGNSGGYAQRISDDRDHPRLRGEQQGLSAHRPQGRGSPPLARGTAIKQGAKAPKGGITPACAGNRYLVYIFAVK